MRILLHDTGRFGHTRIERPFEILQLLLEEYHPAPLFCRAPAPAEEEIQADILHEHESEDDSRDGEKTPTDSIQRTGDSKQ